jgi:hypothetical protein
MNKIFSVLIINIIVFNGFGVFAQINNDNDIGIVKESILLNDPIFNYKNDFLSIEIDNSTTLYDYGKPMLPVIRKCFSFPLGTSILDVKVECNNVKYEISKKIYPCQKPIIDNEYNQFNLNNMFIDENVYFSDSVYPENPITIKKGAGLDNGEHVLFLNIQISTQYNPNTNIISIPKNIDIEVYYKPPEKLLLNSDEYDMIIITPEIFVENLQSLIDHKNSVGVITFLKTTEEIYSEYSGRDYAEQIKYFIKDAIENFGIKYLLIIGDIDLVPMRKSDVTVFTGPTIWKGILTDLYYADIYDSNGDFSSWDSDGDDVYGKCRFDFRSGMGDIDIIDEVDLYPDVGVGRLPCSDKGEVNIVVDKIINYENETNGSEWFNNIILMGGDTFASEYDENIEGEWFLEKYVAPQMENKGFSPVKLYTSLDTLNIILINQEISSGAGFVSYSGHGNTNRIATYSPNDEDSQIAYYIEDIEGMNNGYKLPIFFLDACLTGKLDYNIFDRGILILYPWCLLKILLENIFDTKNFPCFAWTILKKSSGGGIAVIASSQPAMQGIAYQSDDIEILFGANLLHRFFIESYESGIFLSDMLIRSQNSYLNKVVDFNGVMWDHNTINEFNLLGDPSLKIGGYS